MRVCGSVCVRACVCVCVCVCERERERGVCCMYIYTYVYVCTLTGSHESNFVYFSENKIYLETD